MYWNEHQSLSRRRLFCFSGARIPGSLLDSGDLRISAQKCASEFLGEALTPSSVALRSRLSPLVDVASDQTTLTVMSGSFSILPIITSPRNTGPTFSGVPE